VISFLRISTVLVAVAGLCSGAEAGTLEVGVYGGGNGSLPSSLTISNGVASQTDVITWSGQPFSPPIYYGGKITYWPDALPDWGFGIEYTHAKVFADIPGSGVASTYSVLEFTDGLNQVNLNVFRKWELDPHLRAYIGVGAGLNIPHVEVTTLPGSVIGSSETFQYEVAGPVVQAVAGMSYEVFDNLRVFGEAKLAYSTVNAQLAGGAGQLQTDNVTGHLLVGLSYSFDTRR
jgi:lipid A oxidase